MHNHRYNDSILHNEINSMLPIKKETKELTKQQESFLSALFGEAEGSPKKAGEIAGC